MIFECGFLNQSILIQVKQGWFSLEFVLMRLDFFVALARRRRKIFELFRRSFYNFVLSFYIGPSFILLGTAC